ncbi:hypothetical protein [Paenibacillus sp. FSL M7-0420]|uniref:hypothetical protein n=1 Tax=Paenibacillus sp. FSL M7-0420 TaxID=2921609 RepID=UPI0030F5BA07
MDSIRDVRRQLMAYNGLRADRDELLRILKKRDQDIRLGSSFTDGMPRHQGGLPRSSVEGAAIRREEEAEELNMQLVPIERSLAALHWRERQIIRLSFFNIDEDDKSNAAMLGLPEREFNHIKLQALRNFNSLLKYERRPTRQHEQFARS